MGLLKKTLNNQLEKYYAMNKEIKIISGTSVDEAYDFLVEIFNNPMNVIQYIKYFCWDSKRRFLDLCFDKYVDCLRIHIDAEKTKDLLVENKKIDWCVCKGDNLIVYYNPNKIEVVEIEDDRYVYSKIAK